MIYAVRLIWVTRLSFALRIRIIDRGERTLGSIAIVLLVRTLSRRERKVLKELGWSKYDKSIDEFTVITGLPVFMQFYIFMNSTKEMEAKYPLNITINILYIIIFIYIYIYFIFNIFNIFLTVRFSKNPCTFTV